MARTTPQVVNDLLIQGAGQAPIAVGSQAWFEWLDQAMVFAVRDRAGSFTARHEARTRGGRYWRAYRTVGGRQRRMYLGRSAELTPERLRAAAAQLAAEPLALASATADRPPDPPKLDTLPPTLLLATKLYVPQTRGAGVPRARLLARLDAGLRGALTLVAAPAGFGKTTLLASWLASLAEGQKAKGKRQNDDTGSSNLLPFTFSLLPSSAAWLSLDSGDNDPVAFLRYLIAALQRAVSSMGEMALALIETPQLPPLTTVLIALINDLAAQPGRIVLVLDDYHVITTPAIHSALVFLLDHLPPALHIVVASREDPPLPLARMRARGQVNELRAADLRFTAAEAAIFLRDVMGIDVGESEVAALEARTEGWVAGLQLAALAMQEHPDRSGFIAAFAGSNRFVVDYLAAEVLDRLPEHQRQFVLRTSILDRMCGPLCDAVLERQKAKGKRQKVEDDASLSPFTFYLLPSQQILEELERANLFLVPLDDQRRWYRYHQLFAGVLRERLGRSVPAARLAELHRRASLWLEQQGLHGEAIQHALSAGEIERAAGMVEMIALGLTLEGQHDTVGGWLARIPARVVERRPRLLLVHAHVAGSRADYAGSLAYLGQIAPEQSAADPALAGEIAALRAFAASMLGDAHALELGQAALEQLPARHPLRGITAAALAYGYFYIGDLAATEQLLQQALVPQDRAPGALILSTGLLALLAMVRRAQGRLSEVVQLSGEVLARSTTRDNRALPVPSVFLAYLLLGLTQCERNELDAAERTLRQCLQLAADYNVTTYEILGQFYLAHVLSAQGDLAGALRLVEQAESAAPGYLPPSNLREFAGFRVLLWLRLGRLAEAAAWAEANRQLASTQLPRFSAYDYDRFAIVQALIAIEQWGAAETLAAELLGAADATGHGRFVIWALVLRALIAQGQGDIPAALAAIERALGLGEPEGYVRVFADAGPRLVELLGMAAARGIAPGYIERLLNAFPDFKLQIADCKLEPEQSAICNLQSAMVEPLSPRELEVLRLLAAGHDNAAIAEQLVVAVSTVKSHVNHLLGKLGARNRLEAVLRAQELGLL